MSGTEDGRHLVEREGRRLALRVLFEADFGQRTPARILERAIEDEGVPAAAAEHARRLVEAVVRHRTELDQLITDSAPRWPVTQLAKIDRALLRSALGELLHSPTPARVAISEWVGLARTYSGEPARRLLNGVLGRIADGGQAPDAPERRGRSRQKQEDDGGRRPPTLEEGAP